MTDRCEYSGLLKPECAHCGAAPGSRIELEPPRPRVIGRSVFATLPTPPDPGKPLRLGRASAGVCACGQPTRDGAYGCDDCAGELHRIYSETPWLVEQLDTSITRQRGKHTGAGGGETLPWLDRAALAQRRVTGLLSHTVRLCIRVHVPHQSPNAGPPIRGAVPASRWLLWRVDALPRVALFPDILRASVHTERHVLHVIDCEPDLLYLGSCNEADDQGVECGGAIYAFKGEDTGKCRACRAQYLVEPRRAALFADLDDRLFTAEELARLTTYLDLGVDRDKVRKLINQWHIRGRLQGHGDPPRFRYAEAVGLLAATYNTKGA